MDENNKAPAAGQTQTTTTVATAAKSGAVAEEPIVPVKPEPRFEIRTPNPGFRGERAGVKFMEGIGHTDDEAAAEACLDFGYTVLVTNSDGKKRKFSRKPAEKK